MHGTRRAGPSPDEENLASVWVSLAEQVNRAAVSAPSNIAEGVARLSRGEFRYHVSIALGSIRELETQLLLGARIGAVPAGDAAEVLAMADEVGRMLTRLGHRLK
ncbi:MAG TPA: four helix bundle protein [Gemmatimonadales bacterium]|nr:four helix bundle protein [Gemmatimonadales bacterium]